MSERIRWRPNGHGGLIGSVGTVDPWLFQIWTPYDAGHPEWVLTSVLHGMEGRRSHGDGTSELKPRAEEWLAEFVASLGAMFPAREPDDIACGQADETGEDG